MTEIQRRVVFAVLLALLTGMSTGCTTPEPTLRVLSYNIHHGQGTDGVFDLERIAAVIDRAQPDLVALQEVDRETGRASGVDQAAELGRLTGLHHRFGAAMPFDGGEYGEAVLTRLPMMGTANHALPYTSGYEPRCALAVTVDVEGIGEVTFVGTHFQHNHEGDRVDQSRELNRLYADDSDSVAILAGDLNAQPTDEPMRVLLEHWALSDESVAPTYPALNPDRKIDYVLLRPRSAWEVVSVEVLHEPVASDHAPLLVLLRYCGD